jgi:hypothetical protein
VAQWLYIIDGQSGTNNPCFASLPLKKQRFDNGFSLAATWLLGPCLYGMYEKQDDGQWVRSLARL